MMFDFSKPTRDTVMVTARNAWAKRMFGGDWDQCAEGSEVIGGHGVLRVFHGPQSARHAAHDLRGATNGY